MFPSSWLSWPFSSSHYRRGRRHNSAARRTRARLFLEQLESRVTPSIGLSTLGIFNDANNANGAYPLAGLIMDGSGNLYGTASQGGHSNDGAVFEVAKGSGTITLLASFNDTGGYYPFGSLIMDSSGNLYGTTYENTTNGDGTVFELAAGSGTITTLATFNGANGANPMAGLIMDSSGNLYGTAYDGGSSDDGTVFEVAKGSGTITTLASFDFTDGAGPIGGLLMDSSGNLFGTTEGGGAYGAPNYGDGTVFELAKGSSTITTLASFNGTNGEEPRATPIMDKSGNLYGTTDQGGASNVGTVFELAHGTSTITTLVSCNDSTGGNPAAGLVMDSSGNLYGTGVAAGPWNDGGVFELAHGSSTLTTLVTFDGDNGADPLSGLIIDSSGNLYGTTSEQSASAGTADGTVFELSPHTPALSWSTPADITYGTPLSSTQLDATASDSVTGATVAGTFAYTPSAGTILQAGNQTLTVTFTPANTSAYSPITTRISFVVDQATSVLTWNTPAAIGSGTPLSSVQLDATAASSNTGVALSGTFAYTPPAGTILGRGTSTLTVTFTPADAIDFTTATASVTQAVEPSSGLSTLALFKGSNGSYPVAGLIMDKSGNLYGTTEGGGANSKGTVFELASGSGTLTTLASFNGTNGTSPEAGLIMDSTGNLYGTTDEGGADNDGTVFELAAGSGAITPLASFNGSNGANPIAGLILSSSGNLYGTTEGGGANGDGTVFEVVAGSRAITTLASFNGSNGASPDAGLIMDKSGNLYGAAETGGADNDGTIFELPNGSGTINALASFSGANGDCPFGIVMDSTGNLYGTTCFGGANGDGAAFELAAGSATITLLASFNVANGKFPEAGLIMDGSGNLYGTAQLGGADGDGTVFELAEGSGTISTLASFNPSNNNGLTPLDGLIMDSSGNLYGTTSSGGIDNDGIVFELLPHTPALSWNSLAPITYGSALGSTQLDASAADSSTGAPVAGTYVYTPAAGAILPGGWQTLSVTFTPTDTTDFSSITTQIALDVKQATPVLAWSTPAAITYGTPLSSTQLDATAADPTTESAVSGTFVYNPSAGTILGRGSTTLTVTFTPTSTANYTTVQATVALVVTPSLSVDDVPFSGANGADPVAGLIMDSSGNLYGTTRAGGANADGTVFELAAGSSTITTLASFNGSNGRAPVDGLIMDSSGNLYGTTEYGGANGGTNGDGTIFELANGSSTITTLASFNATNGSNPLAGLIMDSSGNLYGTTENGGGFNRGTIFEVAMGSGTITTLASFDGGNGANPVAGLIMNSSGNLFGTTDSGGASSTGTVFELVSGSGIITTLASFNGPISSDKTGEYPQAGLIMDASGNLYGTTEKGVRHGDGTVFEVSTSRVLTTIVSFSGSNGEYPFAGLIMDASGNFYGTTEDGGASGDGTIFEVTAGGVLTTMISFAGSSAEYPLAGLITDSSGNLYGTTEVGGAHGDGTVFELPVAAPPTVQISGFASSTRAGSPQNFTVTIQNAGGTTDTGYTGTLHFTSSDLQAVLPANFTFTAANAGVYTFTATLKTAGTQSITASDTANRLVTGSATTTVTPAAASRLTLDGFPSPTNADSAGNMIVSAIDAYGNVATGYTGTVQFTSSDPEAVLPASYTFTSADAGGHVFSATLNTVGTQSITVTDTVNSSMTGTQSGITVTPAGAFLSTLASFTGPIGEHPADALIMDSSGNLYGTTRDGGAYGDGTIFELAKGSGTITSLASFNGTDGADPEAGLIMDSSGNLYGTATDGGANSNGTVFELVHGSRAITTLASFNGTNGATPSAGLIMDSSGNLYGTASLGGTTGDGTVFELARGSGKITTLATFNGTDGESPDGALIMDSSGNLYSTTSEGGTSNDGTVFELAQGSGTITMLASFNGTNGSTPLAGLIMDSGGNLYGTAYGGGPTGDGTVFELAQGSGTITTLASFNSVDGLGPFASLLMDSSGNLYGTTSGGGFGWGTVFELAKGSGTITDLALFGESEPDAQNPLCGLIMDSSANLYGTTLYGGADGDGTVFKLPTLGPPSVQISGFPSTTSAGSAQTFTVTIQNANGSTDTGYSGTLAFTSSDPQAVLPANFTFTAANAGVYTFTATLKTAGTQSITATDTTNSLVTGSATTTVTAAAASSLTIGGFPSPTTAGSAGNVTVTLLDAYGNIATGFTGSVQFTSSDAKAVLPANFTFTAANAGTHVFSATLKTAGTQSITVTDTVNSGMTSTQTGITVNPAAASVLAITDPSSVTPGAAFSISVAVEDAYGNVATGFTGTLHFTSTDPRAVLPADYAYTAADAGVHTFTATLETAGTQSITATDTTNSLVTGTATTQVTTTAASSLTISGFPSPTTAGSAGNVTVTALDAYGNVATGFTGTIQFASSDPQAVLPANFTFTAADSGTHVFSLTLKTAATQSITVTDTANPGMTSTQKGITVNPAAASVLAGTDPSRVTAGAAFSITVTADDAYGNVATGFTGTLYFKSTDPRALLPANYAYTAADAGVHTFTATLETAGTQSITATDTANSLVTGTATTSVTAAAASSLTISGFPSPTTAGSAGNVTVTALDAYGNVATGYTGTVHFASSDSKAVLPTSFTFTAANAGTHVFSATLKTAGTQSITVTDTVNSGMTSTQTGITVKSAAASLLTITEPSRVTAGAAFSITVTADDAYGNVATGFTGTLHFKSTDRRAVLPANYAYTAADAGVHTFTATLETAGTQSITATDTANSLVTGSATTTVTEAAASSLIISGFPSPTTAGSAGDVTVMVLDAYGNVATGFTGTIQFASSYPGDVLPANFTFTAADSGTHVFSVTLKTAGTQSIAAADATTPGLTSTQSGITVNPAAASVLAITGPSRVIPGAPLRITVTAYDAYGNVATGYTGTLHFKSSDRGAKLPKNYTFTASDQGTHIFTRLELKKKGKQPITAMDTLSSSITGSLSVDVS